jgi:hypothetical protein
MKIRRKLKTTMIVTFAMLSGNGELFAQQPADSPVELVRRVAQTEIAASNGNGNVMFSDRKENADGSWTKLIVKTCQGMAGMLVAINDKPLTQDQRRAEDSRLAQLITNPKELRKKQRSEKEDAVRFARIVKALPDAFLYEPDGTEMGNQEMGKPGEPLMRLKFRPNPQYSPPSRVEQVLTGMQGYILIDTVQHRIAKIDGTLDKEVGFGWGILAHLPKGGHFLVQQAEVLEGDWEITRTALSFTTGKMLLLKSLNITSDEAFSNFRPAPSNLTFAQGVELLKKQDAELTAAHFAPQRGSHRHSKATMPDARIVLATLHRYLHHRTEAVRDLLGTVYAVTLDQGS